VSELINIFFLPVRVGAIFLEVSSLAQDRDGRELSSSRNGNEAQEHGL
jgi:hypothetical protein